MHKYNIHKHHGPLIIDIDGELWVVDTGSPWTIGSAKAVRFAGDTFAVGHRLWPETYTSVRDGFNVKTAGLIGTDVLNQLDMKIDLAEHTLTASRDRLECAGDALPLDYANTIPVFQAAFDGFPHRVIFDTGAHISYVHPDLFPEDVNPIRVTDHSPQFGSFETDVTNLLVSVAGRLFPVNCGTLPPPLDSVYPHADVSAIIGLDLCRFAITIGYFPRRNLMVIG